MSDSAKGPLAGYLFQFEKALLLLSRLEDVNDMITIEEIDDIAVHNESGIVLMTVQAKHSISPIGTTFGDTSYALWRTIEIWIQKLKNYTHNENTEFICSTNKKVQDSAFLKKMENDSFENVLTELQNILDDQEQKLKISRKDDPKLGSTIKQTVRFIKYALENVKEFEIIKNNIKIHDEEDVRTKFMTGVHMMSNFRSEVQRENLYHTFYGWITSNSKARWMNSKSANFKKSDFDDKMALIMSSPSIINAVFRTKELLGSISEQDLNQKRKELFVKQIEDLNRNQEAKARKIKEAIQDFICSDIEISYIISIGNYTKKDFDDFLIECQIKWQECFDNHVILELDEYETIEKNNLAVKIFDAIMNHIEMKFNEDLAFTTGNKYIKNGSFLKLSNIPIIGWHPEWKSKYQTSNETE